MNTATKLAAYAGALALVAGVGWAFGATVGPVDLAAAPAEEQHSDAMPPEAMPVDQGHGHGGSDHTHDPDEEPGGLASAKGMYTFTPINPVLPAGADRPFSFAITTRDGGKLTEYQVQHEKLLHLIVVRRDTGSFQHVHPTMALDGTWTATLDVSKPGSYRAFADFVPVTGGEFALGVDLAVPGDFQPVTPEPSRTATVDGFTARLDGDLVAGTSTEVTVSLTRNGAPVTDLQPYLGAYGHLVALRQGDLAYLHVHPEGSPGDGRTTAGPGIRFAVQAPTAGRYRLFLDFQHDGVVRTAEFTVDATGKVSR